MLHFVAEVRSAARRARASSGVVDRVVEIEFDAAAIHAQRHHAVGLQPAGQDVEHGVRPQPVVERVAAAVQAVVAFQRAELVRVPVGGFGDVAAVVEQLVEAGVDVRDVVALEVVVDVDLPVARDVVADAVVVAVALEAAVGAQARVDAGDERVEVRRMRCRRPRRTPGPATRAPRAAAGARRRR